MDQRLKKRLFKLEEQIKILSAVELEYLELEANRKPIWANIFLQCKGANVAEREAMANAHSDWRDFMKGHVGAEASLNREKRNYELMLKALDCEYITYKIEAPVISRQGRGA